MREIAIASGKGVASIMGMTLVVANIETMTPVFKFVGLIFGLVVAVMTAVSIAFDIRRKWRNRNRDKDDL